MANIRDVAEKAGVSIATVSRVLNNREEVSPETRTRVEKVIAEIGYQPNLLGRNLRRSETRMILVSLYSMSNPFYSRVVRGIEEGGRERDYNILIYNNNGDPDRERLYLGLLENRLVDGVILMSPQLPAGELVRIGKEYPLIQCCEYIEDISVPRVSVDNVAAARTAVEHLIERGHRRIAMIGGPREVLSAVQREEGYRQALEENGLSYDPDLIISGHYTNKGGERAARELLARRERPTAIFAISDMMAVGAVMAARDAGLKIPEDMAVVGFDNSEISAIYDPSLTTISQPRYDLGRLTVDLLIEIINGDGLEKKEYQLEHELIVRESSL
ncbi:MAG: LacI family DNA-binding transcriptional regulator [Halanaerobiales bacterium]